MLEGAVHHKEHAESRVEDAFTPVRRDQYDTINPDLRDGTSLSYQGEERTDLDG